MVEFKTKNGMASLESQVVVTPQMAELLKSHDKRVKAFIKNAKLKRFDITDVLEHAVIENKSILGWQISNGDSTKVVDKLEKTHKELLTLFKEEEQKAIAEEEAKKTADEEISLKKIEEAADVIIDKAKTKNIGMYVIAHNGTTGECHMSGTIPMPVVMAILLAANEKN